VPAVAIRRPTKIRTLRFNLLAHLLSQGRPRDELLETLDQLIQIARLNHKARLPFLDNLFCTRSLSADDRCPASKRFYLHLGQPLKITRQHKYIGLLENAR